MGNQKIGGSLVVAGIAILSLLSILVSAESSDLTIGDQAPEFELPGSDDVTYRLAEFRGKQVVVLAWFPKAFTGG